MIAIHVPCHQILKLQQHSEQDGGWFWALAKSTMLARRRSPSLTNVGFESCCLSPTGRGVTVALTQSCLLIDLVIPTQLL